jgi:hypothetical protein
VTPGNDVGLLARGSKEALAAIGNTADSPALKTGY